MAASATGAAPVAGGAGSSARSCFTARQGSVAAPAAGWAGCRGLCFTARQVVGAAPAASWPAISDGSCFTARLGTRAGAGADVTVEQAGVGIGSPLISRCGCL